MGLFNGEKYQITTMLDIEQIKQRFLSKIDTSVVIKTGFFNSYEGEYIGKFEESKFEFESSKSSFVGRKRFRVVTAGKILKQNDGQYTIELKFRYPWYTLFQISLFLILSIFLIGILVSGVLSKSEESGMINFLMIVMAGYGVLIYKTILLKKKAKQKLRFCKELFRGE